MGVGTIDQRRTLKACAGVHVVHDGLADMLYALLPVLAQSLGLSYAQVGVIRAANNLATAALQIPSGLLAERLGALRLLVLGTVVAGIAFLGLAAADSFWPVFFGFLIAGCGGAVQHPLSSSLITAAYPGEGRARALGIYNTFGDIGKFLFVGATVVAVGAGLAWQLPVFVFGMVALGCAVGVWLALVHLPIAAAPPTACPTVDPAPTLGWGFKSRSGAISLGIVASVDTGGRVAFLTFIAFLMIDKGVAASWAAAAVLVTLFGGMCGKFACGLLAERVGTVRAIALTELATALGIVGVIVSPHYAAFVLLPFVGVVLNGTSSVVYAAVSELVDDRRHARAYGLIYTLGSVCGIVAPLLFGFVADRFGLDVTFIAIAASVVALVGLMPVLGRELSKLASPAPGAA